ncbi:MAG: outer membrane protein assembly factor BamD [Magnetococcales bacterium]|nr:outer membrane protein assembly factor BamD [Magnetococcales bacterium]
MIKRLPLLLLMIVLAGCASKPEPEDTRTPDVIYKDGMAQLQAKQYKKSVKFFEDVDQKYLASVWATRARMNLIYAHHKAEEYPEAVSAAERFIKLHPRHPHAAYAYYMRALSFYRQITDAFRDQEHTRQAMAAFKEVMARFPKTDYAWEAERMMKVCRDHLAEQEIVVARYYLDHEEYIAAVNRFRSMVEHGEFSRTPYVEEALFSLVVTHLKLGLPEDARNYAAVLGRNFPNGAFYQQANQMLKGEGGFSQAELENLRLGVDESSWLKRFLDGMTPGVPGMTNY